MSVTVTSTAPRSANTRWPKKSKSLKALNSQVYTSFLLNGISFVVRSFVGVRPSGGEFPNREFPRSGIDWNSSGIPFSKMAFSGNSWEFIGIPIQGRYIGFTGGYFYLQGGIVLFTGRCLFIAPLNILSCGFKTRKERALKAAIRSR